MIFITFTQARSRARGRKPKIGLFTELSQENGEKLLGSFPLVWDSIRVVNKRQAVVSQREEITQPPERHQDALRGIHCRIPSRSFKFAFRLRISEMRLQKLEVLHKCKTCPHFRASTLSNNHLCQFKNVAQPILPIVSM